MQSVLVVQLARLGDIIQTKRLILSLTQKTNTQVYVCVDQSLCAITQQLYPEVIVLGIPAHNLTKKETALAQITAACHSLASISFSQVYTLNNSPLSYAIARLFPPEIVIGYSADYGQNKRSHICQLASRWTAHRQSSPLNLVDFWAFFTESPIPPEKVNPIPKRTNYNRIGIALAGREQRRSLPPQILAQCIHAFFIARNAPTFVCIGTKQEQKVIKELATYLPPTICAHLEDMAGKTSLTDLPDLVSSLDCLITPDTGIMHLAAHLGVPVQAFFLSSAWCFETGPYGLGHTVWQASTRCAPCLESAPCNHNMECLTGFSHKNFLTHLSGKYTSQWAPHITGYISMFDALGVTYTPVDGNDNGSALRQQLRHILAQHFLHIPQPAQHIAAEHLFYEQDWMLPTTKD